MQVRMFRRVGSANFCVLRIYTVPEVWNFRVLRSCTARKREFPRIANLRHAGSANFCALAKFPRAEAGIFRVMCKLAVHTTSATKPTASPEAKKPDAQTEKQLRQAPAQSPRLLHHIFSAFAHFLMIKVKKYAEKNECSSVMALGWCFLRLPRLPCVVFWLPGKLWACLARGADCGFTHCV